VRARTLALLLLLVPSLARVAPLAADWETLYAARLADNLAYRKALSQLRQAELEVARQQRVYLPYLGLRSVSPTSPTSTSSISMTDGVLQSSALAVELRFENLFGADLTFMAPLVFGGSPAPAPGNPNVTLSRPILAEPETKLLRAHAALIRAGGSVQKAASEVRLGLVSDILDAYRSVRVVETHRRNLATLERLREVTRNETDVRAVERRILQARRAILVADEALQAIDAGVRAEAEALYPEVKERLKDWVQAVPAKGAPPPESAELAALRLELTAAERERSLWFLPYLPNPTVSAGLAWDFDKPGLSWQVSLLFSTDVIDRGERQAASRARREGPDLARIGLESAERSLQRSVASAWNALEVLDLDRRLQSLDMEDAREIVEQWRELFAGGFVTEEDVAMVEIDLTVEELDAVGIEHAYLRKQLELLQYFHSAPGGEAKQE
jgi:outer membrane protein TolC